MEEFKTDIIPAAAPDAPRITPSPLFIAKKPLPTLVSATFVHSLLTDFMALVVSLYSLRSSFFAAAFSFSADNSLFLDVKTKHYKLIH